MKKLFILIAGLLMITAISFGQAELVVKKSQNHASFNIENMSSVFITKDDSLSYNEFKVILQEKNKLQFYTMSVKMAGTSTEITDTTNALVRSMLYAGYGDVMTVVLDTVDWAMTTADTTFLFQDVTTGTDADYLYLINRVMEDSTNMTINLVEIKVTDK